jgi:glycosyltransferase involved in cell wall biosynthesis
MRLLALVKDPNHVCCRYRLTAFRPYFARAGHDFQILNWPTSWWHSLAVRNKLRQADIVIIQRRLLSPLELLLIRHTASQLMFDFDDAVFVRDSYSQAGLASGSRLRGFRRMVSTAHVIIAGNNYLGARAAAEKARAVHVVPTCVDPARCTVARHERSGACIKLAWIGSSSTLQGLQRSCALWNHIGQRCSGVKLKLICDAPLTLTHMPVEFCSWSESTESQALAEADIGISWLPDDDWSRGKCGLKLLQYMAAGLPVIANPVGVQKTMVRHGENGFLAETPEEWCTAVSRLAADPALRRRLGQAGRQLVEKEYSVAAGAKLWLNLLADVGERRGVSPPCPAA